jgi:DNA-binding XRE family transcriptional regulator
MATRRSPTARDRRLIVELKRLREEQGLTREQVADRIGTSETSIFRYEKGETRPQPALPARSGRSWERFPANRDTRTSAGLSGRPPKPRICAGAAYRPIPRISP